MRSVCFHAALVAAVALVLSGCSARDEVTGPLAQHPPVVASPTTAIRLFERG